MAEHARYCQQKRGRIEILLNQNANSETELQIQSIRRPDQSDKQKLRRTMPG